MSTRRRRTPGQTLFTLALLLAGLWVGIAVVRGEFQVRAQMEEPHQRPNLSLVDATPEELVAARFHPRALELPWQRISVRLYQDAEGNLLRVLACDIPASALPELIKLESGVRRPQAAGPPPWWPWHRERLAGESVSPWRVPDWFLPSGDSDLIVERRLPGEEAIWEGLYVNYDMDAERLWLWQWRRKDWQPPAQLSTEIEALDALAQGFGAHLIAIRHPVSEGGWIYRPGQEIGRSGVPREVLPPQSSMVDLALRPSQSGRGGDHDYLIALHGVQAVDLPALLRDHPLRPLADDSPAPWDTWDFARPAERPLWFNPGPGPRWASTVVFPGVHEVYSGRWVAYDAQAERLLIWDWARSQGQPSTVDLVRDQAMPEWPDDPWRVPGLDRPQDASDKP